MTLRNALGWIWLWSEPGETQGRLDRYQIASLRLLCGCRLSIHAGSNWRRDYPWGAVRSVSHGERNRRVLRSNHDELATGVARDQADARAQAEAAARAWIAGPGARPRCYR